MCGIVQKLYKQELSTVKSIHKSEILTCLDDILQYMTKTVRLKSNLNKITSFKGENCAFDQISVH